MRMQQSARLATYPHAARSREALLDAVKRSFPVAQRKGMRSEREPRQA